MFKEILGFILFVFIVFQFMNVAIDGLIRQMDIEEAEAAKWQHEVKQGRVLMFEN